MPLNYKDVYELIDKRTIEILDKLDVHEKRISALENLKTQVILLAGFAGVAVSLGIDWFKAKVLNIK